MTDIVEVTRADRDAAWPTRQGVYRDEGCKDYWTRGVYDDLNHIQSYAAHRIAAEKAVLDRLRGWTDDDHEYLNTTVTPAQANALADIFEQQSGMNQLEHRTDD